VSTTTIIDAQWRSLDDAWWYGWWQEAARRAAAVAKNKDTKKKKIFEKIFRTLSPKHFNLCR